MKPTDATPLLTVGEIARRLQQPIHRIEYLIRTRKIVPTSVAGNARVFTEADVAFLESTIAAVTTWKTNDSNDS